MPEQNDTMDMKQKKERMQSLLQQDVRKATNLYGTCGNAEIRREDERYSVENTRADVQFIDEMLELSTTDMEIADEDVYRLKAIQGRNLSHLLLNEQKFGGDSAEMTEVKNRLEELENLVAEKWTTTYNEVVSGKVEAAYMRAIAACQYYCDHKNPSFQTGIDRKKRVQETLDRLREESRLLTLTREVIASLPGDESWIAAGNISSAQDMMVFAQKYLATHDNSLEALEKETAVGVRALTFEDFAAMIGTYNRGEVEYSNGGLHIINNGWLANTGFYKENIAPFVNNGTKTVENYQMRERLFELIEEKLAGTQPEFLEDAREQLGIGTGAKKAGALSREVLVRIVALTAAASSDVAGALKKGRPFEGDQVPMQEQGEIRARHRLAMVAQDLFDIGGSTNDSIFYDGTEQQKELLRAKINEVLARGEKLGVEAPSLTKHQMDNLVNGNLLIVRDQIFASLNQVYRYVSHMNGGAVADFNKLAIQKDMIDKIAALTLSRYVASSEAGKALTEFELQNYIKECAFQFSGKKELEQAYGNMYIGQLANGGSDGLDFAVERRLGESTVWKNRIYAVRKGVKRLRDLCEKMRELAAMQEMALNEGLNEEEAARMRWLGLRIELAFVYNDTSVNELELVAEELKGTRFATGYAQAKKLVESGFLFSNATDLLAKATTCQKPPRVERAHAPADTEDKLRVLDKDARAVADVLLLSKNPSGLIKENEDENAKSLIRLRVALRKFPKDQVYVKDLKVAGVNVRLVQKADNSLHLIVNQHAIPLTQDAQRIANALEDDVMEHDQMYGRAHAKELLDALDVSEENRGTMIRSRSLCARLLTAETGQLGSFFTNLSPQKMQELAQYLLNGEMSAEEVIGYVSSIDTRDYLNGKETLSLLKKMAQAKEGEVQVEMPQNRQEEVNENESVWSAEQKKVQSLIADLIFSKDTWKADDTLEQPGKRLKNMLMEHIDTLVFLLHNTDMIDRMLEQLPFPEVAEEEKNTEKDIRAQISAKFKEVLKQPEILGLRMLYFESLQKGAIEKALGSDRVQELLVELDHIIDEGVASCVGEIQEQIKDLTKVMFDAPPASQVQQEQRFLDPRERGIGSTEKRRRMKLSKEKLNSIIENAAKGSQGQGLFIKKVLENYFANVSAIDQRAMLASAIRNVKPMAVLPENATEEDRQRELRKSMGSCLGGFLKGAGPLLQKMLQGMPAQSMPAEIRDALEDMKSNLSPIPEEIVKAQLQNMIDRSEKRITRIEVTSALGAASIAQAFLCKLYGPNLPEEGRDVVVKMLRPDVRNHMNREKNVMIMCAKMTDGTWGQVDDDGNPITAKGGMEATYEGQLARIEEELDFTIEARNVQKGNVYNESYTTLQTMKLNSLVEPTANALVLERAPGMNADKYMRVVRKQQQDLLSPFYVRDEQGNVLKRDAGRGLLPALKYSSDTVNRIAETRRQLAALLEQLQKRQKYMMQLVEVWVKEGIYGSGFYHGDLHAGNFMLDDSGLTVIDFGNVTKLSLEQQEEVTRMMMAASVGDVETFRHGFHMLLENTPESEYQKKRPELTRVFQEVFALGDQDSAGARIMAALMKAQELGIELPPAIHNFSQCQIRLQNSVDDMNACITDLQKNIMTFDQMMNQTTALDVYDSFQDDFAMLLDQSDETIGQMYQRALKEVGDVDQNQMLEELRNMNVDRRRAFDDKYMVFKGKSVSIYEHAKELRSALMGISDNPEILKLNASGAKDTLEDQIFDPLVQEKFFDVVKNPADKEEFETLKRELNEGLDHITEGFERFDAAVEHLKSRLERKNPLFQQEEELKQRLDTYRTARSSGRATPEELERMEREFCESYAVLRRAKILDSQRFVDFRKAILNPEAREDVNENLRGWFADTTNHGAELREAYEVFRAAEAEQAQDWEQKLNQFLEIYRSALVVRLSRMEEVLRQPVDMKKPGNFIKAMGGVLEENLKASLWRMGFFTARRYKNIMEEQGNDDEDDE